MASDFGLGDLAAAGLSHIGIGPLNVGNMLDTVEFVKKAWSSFGVPSSFAPTVDLDELDRRIGDLKAVEQWLTVNLNLLQGTIQAIEIQRGTIATLKAYGGALGAPAAAMPGAQAIADVFAAGAPSASGAQATRGANEPDERKKPATDADERTRDPVDAAHGHAGSRATGGAPGERSPGTAGAPDPSAALGLDPTAWWNLLQGQFNQIASAALSGVGLPSPSTDKAVKPPRQRSEPAAARRATKQGAQLARGTRKEGSGKSKPLHAAPADSGSANSGSASDRTLKVARPRQRARS